MGYRLDWVDLAFKDVKPEEFDGLIIPGGRVPEFIRTFTELEPIVRHFLRRTSRLQRYAMVRSL
jgi:protease I